MRDWKDHLATVVIMTIATSPFILGALKGCGLIGGAP